MTRFVIVGGAGFIGSHFTDHLLGRPDTSVRLYDNFSSGQPWHYVHHRDNPRFDVVRGEVADRPRLTEALRDADVVIHLASNPDIAKAITEPDVDFREGTELTNHVAEAMRLAGVKRILYASGSGVYGELGEIEAQEDHGPLEPISTYGASKLAGEALLCSYAYMFGWQACAFRFGNVVGRRQTHGVGFDFVRRLRADPTQLKILGDGSQSKSYVWVGDVVAGVMLAHERAQRPFQVYNIATGDYITVREIASLAMAVTGATSARLETSGGDRGWKGDVPIVRLSIEKIRALGWSPTRTTAQALTDSMKAMLADLEAP